MKNTFFCLPFPFQQIKHRKMIGTKKQNEEFDADDDHHSAASINTLKRYTSIVIIYIANMSKAAEVTIQQINT